MGGERDGTKAGRMTRGEKDKRGEGSLVDSALLPPDLPDAPPRAVQESMCAGLALWLDV